MDMKTGTFVSRKLKKDGDQRKRHITFDYPFDKVADIIDTHI